MLKVGFVILHYQTIEDTTKCVESIVSYIKKEDYEIVIIDNGSTNGTGKILSDKFQSKERIHVIVENKNLGFAKGNNIGFKYCKEYLNCDFIVLLNNDTEIIQEDFVEKINREYQKSNFAVLGPQIILADKKINPIIGKMRSVNQIKNEIIKLHMRLVFNYLHIEWIIDFGQKLLKRNTQDKTLQDQANMRIENIVLHGCCLIFSRQYIDRFDGLNDSTFLYHEEELLYERIRKNGLKIIYNPEVKIHHKEYGSTKYIGKTKNKIKRFRYKNLIISGKILYNELKNANS